MSAAQPRPTSNVVHIFGRQLPDVGGRMKELARQSYDTLLLANGPPAADYELLDLCGDALYYAKASSTAWEKYRATGSTRGLNEYQVIKDLEKELTQRLRRAKKMKATTPAGIYAKALLVRCSKTGAAELAMSLAVDLVDCAGLRETLSAGVGGAS